MPRGVGLPERQLSGEVALEKRGQLLRPCMSGQEGAPGIILFSCSSLQAGWMFCGWQSSGAEERRGGGPSISEQLGFQTLMTFPAPFSATTA